MLSFTQQDSFHACYSLKLLRAIRQKSERHSAEITAICGISGLHNMFKPGVVCRNGPYVKLIFQRSSRWTGHNGCLPGELPPTVVKLLEVPSVGLAPSSILNTGSHLKSATKVCR
jgi:hypothetical protein